jgi:hypothetical protein
MKLRANALLNPWVIFCAWAVLWAGRLWLIPVYYQKTSELGYYPPEADSIAIPVVSHAFMTVIVAPFFAAALWLLLRRSSVDRRIWCAWNRQRWVLSLMWSVLFVLFALTTLLILRDDVRARLPLNALADVCWFLLWLAVRAVVVSRIPPPRSQGPAPNNLLQAAATPPCC